MNVQVCGGSAAIQAEEEQENEQKYETVEVTCANASLSGALPLWVMGNIHASQLSRSPFFFLCGDHYHHRPQYVLCSTALLGYSTTLQTDGCDLSRGRMKPGMKTALFRPLLGIHVVQPHLMAVPLLSYEIHNLPFRSLFSSVSSLHFVVVPSSLRRACDRMSRDIELRSFRLIAFY